LLAARLLHLALGLHVVDHHEFTPREEIGVARIVIRARPHALPSPHNVVKPARVLRVTHVHDAREVDRRQPSVDKHALEIVLEQP
jgi:hypothetical protein